MGTLDQFTALGAGLLVASVASGQELLTNPGFEDLDGMGLGTGWGSFENVGFNDFFGGNPHASFFADNAGNFGGVFELGIAGTAGTLYEFTLTDARIESNFNANFRFGLEFYQSDDATKIDEVIVNIDDLTSPAPTGDSLTFTMTAQAVAGTVFVRPIILFDNAAPSSGSQANAFVFDASLVVVPAPGTAAVCLLGGLMGSRRRRGLGDDPSLGMV